MIYLDLYLTFLKIGFTSFGGLSMIPLINKEMISHGWMNSQEVLNIIAIAESTPGPLGINCATFAGTRAAGVLGGIFAALGSLTPSLTVGILVGYFFNKLKNTTFMQKLLYGIRPTCIALIITTLISLIPSTYVITNQINIVCILISVMVGILMFRFKLSIPKCIFVAGLMGLILLR